MVKMLRHTFGSFEELAWRVVEDMENVEYSVDVVCFYEEARTLIRELILTGACTIGDIDVHSPDFDWYDKEFYVTVTKVIDGEWSIWCEPALREGKDKYVYCDSDIVYVLDNCHSKVLESMRSDVVVEACVVEMDTVSAKAFDDQNEYKCGERCDMCDCVDFSDKDESIKGFTISVKDDNGSTSISFESDSEEMLRDMFNIFKKYRI